MQLLTINSYLIFLIILSLFVISSSVATDWSEDVFPSKWNKYSRNKLKQMLNRKPNQNIAKNIILFLGDGIVDFAFETTHKFNNKSRF